MSKNSIFSKSFDEIFTKERIAFTARKLKVELKNSDIFEFMPHKKVFIPKNDNELREINIPGAYTRVIQKILQEEFTYHFKFSDRSYAYRPGKSPLKAINRVKHIVKNYNFIVKTDIDSFFDSIDHAILLKVLNKAIKDKKIVYLLTMFIKNGSLFKGRWQDKFEGIYQGDVLSPLLSNLYLNIFDTYLEKKDIEFVRFADDLIFFAKNYKEAKEILEYIQKILATLKLTIKQEKTYIAHKSKNFEYLGVIFNEKEKIYSIDNDRLMQKVSKISKETKALNLAQSIEKINEHIIGFKNYYLQVTNNKNQFKLLQERQEEILIQKVIDAKTDKTITKKDDFINILQNALTYLPKENFANHIVQKAYEEIKFKNPVKSAQKDIGKKRLHYFKNYLKQSELIVSKIGTYIYYAQGKIKLRTKNEATVAIPFNKVSRIIITNIKTSISNYLVYLCSKNRVDIDFIYKNSPYALLTYYNTVSQNVHLKQLKLFSSEIGVNYAKALLIAKAKNQINLLKYFNHRRKNEKISKHIQIMGAILEKLKKSKNTKSLMGYEGQISSHYWSSFGLIISKPGFNRTHKDSTDPINQAINYAYAIIYNKVQSALIKEGLNIYYSFLHSRTKNKPTLVFDLIEPFRQPVVDREIIGIITKKQHLKQNSKGLLDEKSKKIIIQNIQERLSIPTKSRYGKTTLINIIASDANSLKNAILQEKDKVKFYIAKY